MTQNKKQIKTNWDKRFMDLATYIAQWSKYPGRKVGAVIVDDRHTVVSIGYNGLVRGSNDEDNSKYKKAVKYLWSEHAERNAIYNAARQLIGTTIYSTLFPCADCARAIIQCGIRKIVSPEPNWDDEGFAASFKISYNMMLECGIEVYFYKEQKQIKPFINIFQNNKVEKLFFSFDDFDENGELRLNYNGNEILLTKDKDV